MSGLLDEDREAERAVVLLRRPGAWLSPEGGGYRVRVGADRRRRAHMAVGEALFTRLATAPGLAVRAEGGWMLARGGGADGAPAKAGRPGVVDGERRVREADGRTVSRAANLGESPLAWLARRKDRTGAPFLTAAELAAGERLRDDYHRAGVLGRLTMNWDAGPRERSARGPGGDPLERGRNARARVAAALEAVGPELRPVLEHACLRETSLALAERALGLPKRTGRTVLKLALQRLAAHYRIG